MRTFPLLIYLVLLHTAMPLLVRAMCSHERQLQFAVCFFFSEKDIIVPTWVAVGSGRPVALSREGCSR